MPASTNAANSRARMEGWVQSMSVPTTTLTPAFTAARRLRMCSSRYFRDSSTILRCATLSAISAM